MHFLPDITCQHRPRNPSIRAKFKRPNPAEFVILLAKVNNLKGI